MIWGCGGEIKITPFFFFFFLSDTFHLNCCSLVGIISRKNRAIATCLFSGAIMENNRRPGASIMLRRNQPIELIEFIEKPHRRVRKLARASLDSDNVDVKDLYESLQRFGPFYNREGSLLLIRPKQATWQHVVSNSPGMDSETEEMYVSAVREILTQAMNTYEEDAVKNYLDDEFIWMMIEDGCFILQVALYLLGGSILVSFLD